MWFPRRKLWKLGLQLVILCLFLCFLLLVLMHWFLSDVVWVQQNLQHQMKGVAFDLRDVLVDVTVPAHRESNTTLGQIWTTQEAGGRAACLPGYYSNAELRPHFQRPYQDSHLPGAGGRAYWVSDLTAEEDQEMRRGYAQYNLNAFVSDRISLHRDLGPDTRPPECVVKKFRRCPPLPSASVIIIFHNEARSTLLRTVHSVLYTVPHMLLHEIILVDDASDHGECWPGWLEPLLERISEDMTCVVSPDIVAIDMHSFQFEAPLPRRRGHKRGAFDWALLFTWEPLPLSLETIRANETQPYWTPAMAGGLFAISKSFFQHIGTYDSQMQIWGGENLEMSLRVWMCGGQLEIVPCSVVGHVFRIESPHSFPGGIEVVSRNLVRLAEVWMDDYKVLFYQRNMEAAHIAKEKSYGDLSERQKLRERLGCKSFRWYLRTLRPDFFIPELMPSFYGALLNKGVQMCLDVGEWEGELQLGLSKCHGIPNKQYFEYTSEQEIRHNVDSELCLSLEPPSISLQPCEALVKGMEAPPYQKFSYRTDGLIQDHELGLCLEAQHASLLINHCDPKEAVQTWIFSTEQQK